jgi:Tfp pilus assembly protein PilN
MSIINLIPNTYLKQRSQQRANRLCVMLFVVVMTGVAGAVWVSHRNLQNTYKVSDGVNQSYSEAAKLLQQMQQLEIQKRKGVYKAKTTSALLERSPRSYILATVTQSLPENCCLTSLDLKPAKITKTTAITSANKKKTAKDSKAPVPPTPEAALAKQPPMEMVVTGWAATDVQVAQFLANLIQDPLLESVELGYSQTKEIKSKENQTTIREFSVTAQIRPEIDVIELIDQREPQETFENESINAARMQRQPENAEGASS